MFSSCPLQIERVMNLQKSLQRISELMSQFVQRVKFDNAMGLLDVNRISEDILSPIFAEVYEYRNLLNLNTGGENFAGIDLGDNTARVAFQITSESSSSKVKETLETFINHEHYKKYSHLIIYIITEKQASYAGTGWDQIVNGKFLFTKEDDIRDATDLLKAIRHLPLEKVQRIESLLENHLVETSSIPPLQGLQSELVFLQGQGEEILKGVQNIVATQQINLENIQSASFARHHFPITLVDQEIEREIDVLRKSRFFLEFDRAGSSLLLADKLVDGELSGGSQSVRSRALAWCVRIMSRSKQLDITEGYLKFARGLGTSPEVEIAQAFIYSEKNDKSNALKTLAYIDTVASRSAAFMVITHHDGPQGAVDWLKSTGIDITNLDSDGKYFLLMQFLELTYWNEALECLDLLTDEDFRNTPILHHLAGLIYLVSTVPDEFRLEVLTQVPFHAANFPLASDADAPSVRQKAYDYFIAAVRVANHLQCINAAVIDEEYALWILLRDPQKFSLAKKELETKLYDTKSALRFVYLGLQFGVALNLELVEQEIERQVALLGGITRDAAVARFALAFTKNTPQDAANYIAQHIDQLAQFINKKYMLSLQIDLFLQAGLLEKANENLDLLIKDGLPSIEENRIRIRLTEAEGTNPIEFQKEHFKKTGALGDLLNLMDELQIKNDWESICEYGYILFEKTHSLRDAERLANSLSRTHKHEKVVEFLETNATLLSQSKNLQMLYCWSLYYEGTLLKAWTELVKINDYQNDANYRLLQINLGIALGDWTFLSAFVAKEYLEREKRSADDLVGAAKLALYVDSHHAKDLIFAAAEKGNDDANILTATYFLASKADLENNDEVFNWLEKAVDLSGENGPMQKMTFQDIVDRKPKWDQRESDILQMLSRGDIPMFLAGQYTNQSLVKLILFPSLANLSETDPRRRSAIPAYSGNQPPVQSMNISEAIGLDATALLTLNFLNILDKVLDIFNTIYLPHSTLAWLFEEKGEAGFHQPSRIRQAHQLRDLLARHILQEFSSSTVPNSDLSAQVGNELASLIAESEKIRDDEIQYIVVRPYPVHRLTALIDEPADLTPHEAILSSCQAIVNKLRQNGVIMANEEKKALAYLQLHEKPWPNQPEIMDGATLYLDDLAITYFLHIGILEKLHMAGFTVVASPDKILEVNTLISYERISDEIKQNIEHIRVAIHSRIETGKIKFSRKSTSNSDNPEEQKMLEHPTASMIALAANCDVIITDDRFLNRHPNITHEKIQIPIFTTLDLLDTLVSIGHISIEDHLQSRNLLRRAGYLFIPI